MTVFPAVKAGAIFEAVCINGAFHGMIAPTTPMDSRLEYWKTPGAAGTV
jgi:hypothetical protein